MDHPFCGSPAFVAAANIEKLVARAREPHARQTRRGAIDFFCQTSVDAQPNVVASALIDFVRRAIAKRVE
jgi:hypothetical protein